MSESSQQAGQRKSGPQSREDEGRSRMVLSLRSREGCASPCNPVDTAAPQAPGQADGGFNFIQVVPIKVL